MENECLLWNEDSWREMRACESNKYYKWENSAILITGWIVTDICWQHVLKRYLFIFWSNNSVFEKLNGEIIFDFFEEQLVT